MGKVLILSHVYAIIRAEFQSSGDLTSGNLLALPVNLRKLNNKRP